MFLGVLWRRDAGKVSNYISLHVSVAAADCAEETAKSEQSAHSGTNLRVVGRVKDMPWSLSRGAARNADRSAATAGTS